MVTIDSADWVLSNVVDDVDGSNKEIPITLAVGGLLISGKLVSGHRFMEHLIGKVITIQPYSKEIIDEHHKTLETVFENMKSNFMRTKDSFADSSHIHLMDVTFSNAASSKPISFWRGSLEKVDGFHFG